MCLESSDLLLQRNTMAVRIWFCTEVTIHQQSWWLSEERHSRDSERRHSRAAMVTFGTPGAALSLRLGIAARKKIRLTASVLLCALIFYCPDAWSQARARDRERYPPGLPLFSGPLNIIHHTGFTLGYDDVFKQARWVVYGLTAEETRGAVKRTDDFRPDPDIVTGSPAPEDYRGSGFDKGHLAPAGDFQWSSRAMSETFFMSNMSPQRPGFNRGIWKKLEERVRIWAQENDTLYIATGPVFSDGMQVIGVNRIAVPGLYYKVLLDITEPELKAIGFVLPNESSSLPLQAFAVTVDSVESLTGIDFYPQLPDELENWLESHIDIRLWFIGEPSDAASYRQKALPKSSAVPAVPPVTKPQPPTSLPNESGDCSRQCPPERRMGARCMDGTSSRARGRGACAGHGGVDCWECGKYTEK